MSETNIPVQKLLLKIYVRDVVFVRQSVFKRHCRFNGINMVNMLLYTISLIVQLIVPFAFKFVHFPHMQKMKI